MEACASLPFEIFTELRYQIHTMTASFVARNRPFGADKWWYYRNKYSFFCTRRGNSWSKMHSYRNWLLLIIIKSLFYKIPIRIKTICKMVSQQSMLLFFSVFSHDISNDLFLYIFLYIKKTNIRAKTLFHSMNS